MQEERSHKARSPSIPDPRAISGGLYPSGFEHDACGVGFVCRLNGTPSHGIVQQGIEILLNLSHRGACGCDQATGDGAGILIQLPHKFLKNVCRDERIRLPDKGRYGAGLVFLPRSSEQRRQCMRWFENVVAAEGQQMLGWRRVPVISRHLGALSRQEEPVIYQVFIGRGSNVGDGAEFERKLYLIRRVMENTVRTSRLPERTYFHVPSLSAGTMVYKGMFLAHQLADYFPDLRDPELASAMAIVHQRYSTNTFPAWSLAQPFRLLCHNGEINTLRGNVNWINARQHQLVSELFGDDLKKLLPVATPGGSDSAILDNLVELLVQSGRSLPHAVMMLIPEAWQNHATMDAAKKAFYAYHACLVEPWDGPAAIAFTDGRYVGAVLDRNGLRPSRYTLTRSGLVVMASETGVLDIAPEDALSKGRLQPGRMFLVDLQEGRLVEDEEIKSQVAARRPYRRWLDENLAQTADLPQPKEPDRRPPAGEDRDVLRTRQKAFGYTREDLNLILGPMALSAKEPIGSMGDDIPPAVLSTRPRLLYDYFKQLFAQVTNPPLDAIREELVTSMVTTLGAEQGLLQETPQHCRQLRLESPILTQDGFLRLKTCRLEGLRPRTLDIVYRRTDQAAGLKTALEELCREASAAVDEGAALLILSDRSADQAAAAVPALLAVAAVHHHLIREGRRTRCGIIVESAEPRETHHFCCLLGFGAGAVYPYLAYETVGELIRRSGKTETEVSAATANYIAALHKGILKVMSKMGLSTLQSYRGAQLFECVGLDRELVETFFTGTASRIGGSGLEEIAREIELRHRSAYPERPGAAGNQLDAGGKYQWRRQGESHQYSPLMLASFRQAVFDNDRKAWQHFSSLVRDQNRSEGLIRGLLDFKPAAAPVPLEEVEPWTEIVKRFKTGAMSYGSISKEAHETLAIAMNRIGARSNSGEGGEDPERYHPDANGDWRNSTIKQVASGRFGVTGTYLVNATEIQIKMAQGAKPGEGGQLPGFKVYPWIARTRHSTPYVGLISPPPHHDIYSIEDLAQLIHDLRCANPRARISVKLVSEVGVGTVAAGVAKGGADVVLVSGEVGGTGASPLSSIRHAGMPWEIGLPEAHQTLVINGLRSRIVVECDGQLKTGRDVAIACLLGAEEFGFGTIALVALGCIMMRVCHLNTCPVGIATQDPQLRRKFTGKAEHVIQFMRMVSEELREIMAFLGIRRISEMVGRSDLLNARPALDHWKARGLDLSPILHRPAIPAAVAAACTEDTDLRMETETIDQELLEAARPAWQTGRRVRIARDIRNVHRTFGTLLSSEIHRRYGEKGLPDDTITIHCQGSAGQSFFAFGAKGISVVVEGDANDYFGKGLCGTRLVLKPHPSADFSAEHNIICGNVAFYGGTSGEGYVRGIAGERFCVRNSGVQAVVEGVGDHACEYMTGGTVVILGPTGRNTAAGMSGGIAFVLDEAGDFGRHRCNRGMVDLEAVETDADTGLLRSLVENHLGYTGSVLARRVLNDWDKMLEQFIKIIPREYKHALERGRGEKREPSPENL